MLRPTTTVGQLESVAPKLRRSEVKGRFLKYEVAGVLYMIVESDAARPFVMVLDLCDCAFSLPIAVEEMCLLAKLSTTGPNRDYSLPVVMSVL